MKTILKIILILIVSVFASNSQWSKLTFNPTMSLFSCFFLSSQTGWVAGQENTGKIFYTQNGGQNWLLAFDSGTNERIECLFFLNSQTGWAGSYNRYVYKTTNGGANWTAYSTSAQGRIRRILFTDANKGWFMCENGVWKSSTGGLSWQNANFSSPTCGIFFINNNTGFVTTFNFTTLIIFKTIDGGTVWSTVYLSGAGFSINCINFLNGNTGIAVGYKRSILKTTNTGDSWNIVSYDSSSYPVFNYVGVKFIDSFLGYTCGQIIFPGPMTTYVPIINKTTNGGLTWQAPVMSPVVSGTEIFESMDILEGQTGYAVGAGGNIYKTTSAGYIGIYTVSTEIPSRFFLSQNYPNPFNPSTKIKFSLPNPSEGGAQDVKLVVYDIMGREVASLLPPLRGGEEGLRPGTYEVEWDGSNFSSGVYYYTISSGNYIETKKMVLIK